MVEFFLAVEISKSTDNNLLLQKVIDRMAPIGEYDFMKFKAQILYLKVQVQIV